MLLGEVKIRRHRLRDSLMLWSLPSSRDNDNSTDVLRRYYSIRVIRMHWTSYVVSLFPRFRHYCCPSTSFRNFQPGFNGLLVGFNSGLRSTNGLDMVVMPRRSSNMTPSSSPFVHPKLNWHEQGINHEFRRGVGFWVHQLCRPPRRFRHRWHDRIIVRRGGRSMARADLWRWSIARAGIAPARREDDCTEFTAQRKTKRTDSYWATHAVTAGKVSVECFVYTRSHTRSQIQRLLEWRGVTSHSHSPDYRTATYVTPVRLLLYGGRSETCRWDLPGRLQDDGPWDGSANFNRSWPFAWTPGWNMYKDVFLPMCHIRRSYYSRRSLLFLIEPVQPSLRLSFVWNPATRSECASLLIRLCFFRPSWHWPMVS